MKTSHDGEYFGLQALRAVAALAVVAAHAPEDLAASPFPTSVNWFHGVAGVDLFFVISGFVMMLSSTRLLAKVHPARLFLWRRLLRIAPLYWVLTCAKLALLLAVPGEALHGRPSVWNVVSSFLFIPSAGPGGEVRPVIVVGWTLSFEMAFYLLFAVALLVGAAEAGRRGLLRFLAPAVAVLALLGAVRTDAWPAWTMIADPIVLEFLAGVGVARLVQRRRLPSPAGGAVLVVAGAAALLWTVPRTIPRVLSWGVPAALVVLGVVALEPWLGRRLPRWLLLLGDASYSIYLAQTFALPALRVLIRHLDPVLVHLQPLALELCLVGAAVVGSAVSGVLCYLALERPMTQALKLRFGRESVSPVPQ